MTNYSVFYETIATELAEVSSLLDRIPHDLDDLIATILECQGKLVVTGMGKSGIIGSKIAATLASTGTTSFFVHPGEAYHGDLGMIAQEDIVLAISNSGETEEVLRLISYLKHNNNYLIAMTGEEDSTLAMNANYHLNVGVNKEACPWQLAPTSSTTTSLVIGDALAMTLMKARNFQPQDFALYHPGGSLGKRLLATVEQVMNTNKSLLVNDSTSIVDVIHAITNGRCGVAVVLDDTNKIIGVITDGDLRRAMEDQKIHFFDLIASNVMTSAPMLIHKDAKLIEVEEIISKNKINNLIVSDEGKYCGVVQIYDL